MEEFFAKFSFKKENEGLMGAEFEVIITAPDGSPSEAGFEILKDTAGNNGAPFGEWEYSNGVISESYLEKSLQPAFQRGQFKPELFLEQVEYNTLPHYSLDGFEADLRAGYRAVIDMARRNGAISNFSGLPILDGREVRIFPTKRYESIKERVPDLMPGFTNSIHLHAGIVSPAEGIYLLNSLRVFLPQFLALSANSAVGHGIIHLAESQRFLQHISFVKRLIPPYVRDEKRYVELMREQGCADDPDSCWWAIRLNKVGSIEIRIMDGQDRPEEAVFLARVWSSAVSRAREAFRRKISPDAVDSDAILEQCLQAAYFGLKSSRMKGMMHWFLAILDPYLDHESRLKAKEVMMMEGIGSIRQRKLWESSGSIEEYVGNYEKTIDP